MTYTFWDMLRESEELRTVFCVLIASLIVGTLDLIFEIKIGTQILLFIPLLIIFFIIVSKILGVESDEKDN